MAFQSPWEQPSYKPKRKAKKAKKKAKKKVAKKKKAVRKKATKAKAAKPGGVRVMATRVAGRRERVRCEPLVIVGPDKAGRKIMPKDKKVTHAFAARGGSQGMGGKTRTFCGLEENATWHKRTKTGWKNLVRVEYAWQPKDVRKITCRRCKELVKARHKALAHYERQFTAASAFNPETAWPGDKQLLARIKSRRTTNTDKLWGTYNKYRQWGNGQADMAAKNLHRLSRVPIAVARSVAGSMSSRALHWLFLRQRGATNNEIKSTLSAAFGISGGSGDRASYTEYSGGANPRVSVSRGFSSKKLLIDLKGNQLINATRILWGIGECI